ncbi:MAG: hypothetical protein Q7S16_03945 [bacterium]|nr:hypothetical protein [bacterium]
MNRDNYPKEDPESAELGFIGLTKSEELEQERHKIWQERSVALLRKESRLKALPPGKEAERLKKEFLREWLVFGIEGTKKCLYDIYGVENLSTMEGSILRRIIEEGHKQYQEEEALIDKGMIKGGDWLFQTTKEFAARWLQEAWDIGQNDIPIIKQDEGRELSFSNTQIAPEFKEYIRRLREKSHLL